MNRQTRIQRIALPIAFGIVIVILDQGGIWHRLFGLTPLQLPYPANIGHALAKILPNVWPDFVTTLVPAALGLAFGASLGYVIAQFIHACPIAGFGCLVLMTMVNAIPIVALAPLMNRWFPQSMAAKVVVITIAAMGIMTINVFRGLTAIEEEQRQLFQALSAGRRAKLWYLRMPASLPAVFTALKTSIPAVILATIISEFFASQTSGLGYMIKHSLKMGNHKEDGWAYIIIVSALSLILYGIICVVERRLLHWHPSTMKTVREN